MRTRRHNLISRIFDVVELQFFLCAMKCANGKWWTPIGTTLVYYIDSHIWTYHAWALHCYTLLVTQSIGEKNGIAFVEIKVPFKWKYLMT